MCSYLPQPRKHTRIFTEEHSCLNFLVHMESISDVLSSAYTDSELKHAILVLDQESNNKSIKYSQRLIRTNVENDLFKRTKGALNQMRPLAHSLETLGKHIADASSMYHHMRMLTTSCESAMAVYAQNARFLHQEADSLQSQLSTIEAYMNAVYISDEEREILIGKPHEVLDAKFFNVLRRVKSIHSETAQMLLAEAPSSGEHLMLESGKLLDQAYMRIKFAIDSEMKSKSRNNTDTSSSSLRKYMSLLADRPLLFKAVLEEQSGIRIAHLNREFIQFMATEQPNTHIMPVRCLGSVLAWIHSAIVNEFEYISLLLDPDTRTTEEPSASERSLEELLSTSDTRRIIVDLVDSVIATLENSLRQQINSIIISQTDATIVDELQSVLNFYEHMLSKYEQKTLNALFEQLKESLDRQFTHLLRVNHLTWESRVDVALRILKTYEMGVYNDTELTKQRINDVLDDILKQELHEATPIQALNVLDLAISKLAGYFVVQYKLDEFKTLQTEYIAKQVSTEVRVMKSESKLIEFQVRSLSAREFLISFDEFLSIANIDLHDRLENLNSPTLQSQIAHSAILEFINEYEFTVKDIENARSAEDIRQLLI